MVVGPAFADLLKSLTHHCKVAKVAISLLHMYHFGKYSAEHAKLVPFPFSRNWWTKYASYCFSSDCE